MKSRIKNIFMILSFALLIITITVEKPIRSEAATQDGTYYFSTSMTTKFQVKNNKLTLKVSKNDDSGITKKGDENYKKYSLEITVAKNCKYRTKYFARSSGELDVEKSNYNDVKSSIKGDRDAYVQNGYYINVALSYIVVKNSRVVKIVYSFA